MVGEQDKDCGVEHKAVGAEGEAGLGWNTKGVRGKVVVAAEAVEAVVVNNDCGGDDSYFFFYYSMKFP